MYFCSVSANADGGFSFSIEAPTFFFPVAVFPVDEDSDAVFDERFLFFDAPPRIDNILDGSGIDAVCHDCRVGGDMCDLTCEQL